MKGRVVLLDRVAGREAAALMVDGRLEDLLIDPPEHFPYAPETILRGRLGKPMKGQGGAMVDLPNGQGFLRQIKGLPAGAQVLTQVSGTAEPGKAVPLTQRILLKGRAAILSPGAPGLNVARKLKDPDIRARLQALAESVLAGRPDLGAILRSAAAELDDAAITDELRSLSDLASALATDQSGPPELLLDAPGAHHLAWREWSDPAPDDVVEEDGSFDRFGVLDEIESLLTPRLDLARTGHAYIEPTRALVAVDVNTGSDHSMAAGLKANLALAADLPRQLRLRGLAGQITLDFAPMPKKERRRVEDTLRRAFRQDSAETALAGWTPLGHLELQRKRDRWPLKDLIAP